MYTPSIGPIPTTLGNTSNLDKLDFSSCLVPQELDATDNRYGTKYTQEKYCTECWTGCTKIMSLLEISTSFDTLLKELGNWRHDLAKNMKSTNAFEFGKLRDPSFMNHRISTNLLDVYTPMLKDLENLQEDDPTIEWKHWNKDKDSVSKAGYRIGITQSKTKVQLSRYLYNVFEGKEIGTIAHTYPKNLPLALKQCAFLYDEIMRLDPVKHEDTIRNHIAELHWWFIQTCPYFRGSGSCAEVLVGALTLHKFKTLTHWVPNIHSDRIAIVQACEEFIKLYPTLRLPLR